MAKIKGKILSEFGKPVDEDGNEIKDYDGPKIFLVSYKDRLFIQTGDGQRIAERISDGKGGRSWEYVFGENF